MQKLIYSGKIALLILCLNFISCNTFFWQPVKKLIVGTWKLSPDPKINHLNGLEVTERWTFANDGFAYVTYTYANDSVDTLRYVDCTNGNYDFVSALPYSVESQFHKHYIVLDTWFCGGNPQYSDNRDIGKWLVVEINKSDLYLSAEIENSEGVTVKGTYQKGFIRE